MKRGSRGVYQPPTGEVLAVAREALGGVWDAPPGDRAFELSADGGVAVVEVLGPLQRRAGWLWESYEEIEQRVRAASMSAAHTIMMKIDSPGGDAIGCFECAKTIRALAQSGGKRLLAYADGGALSAAYALACAADVILMPAAGRVGSIGTIAKRADVTGADAQAGIRYVVLASGARKADGDPHTPITKAETESIQASIDELAELFFALVAEMRGDVSAAHVRGLEGRAFHGEAALQAGLADRIASWTEALAFAAEAKSEGPNMDKEKRDAAEKAIRAAFGDDKDGADKAIKSAFPPEDKDKKDDKKEAKALGALTAPAAAAPPPSVAASAPPVALPAAGGTAERALAIAMAAQEENATLRAEMAREREGIARTQLLAKRPDFTAEQLELLAMVSLDEVKKAVEKWPRSPVVSMAGVPTPAGTRGENQTNEAGHNAPGADEETVDYIDRKMGLKAESFGVKHTADTIELGYMSPEDAAKAAQRLAASKGGA